MKLIILSNRLPVKIEKDENNEFIVTPSEGGLATGLGSLETKTEKNGLDGPEYTLTTKMKGARLPSVSTSSTSTLSF